MKKGLGLLLALLFQTGAWAQVSNGNGGTTGNISMDLYGVYTFATLPLATRYTGYTAYTSDQGPVYSNGTIWISLTAPSGTASPFSVGTSLTPTIVPAFTISATFTANSTTFTCNTSCASLAVGQNLVGGSDGVNLLYPAVGGELGSRITNIAGTTITSSQPTNASLTPGTYNLQIGRNRYSTTSSELTNTLGLTNLLLGQAAIGNGTWTYAYLANDCDNPALSTNCSIMNAGTTSLDLNFWAARTSDNTGGTGVEANITLAVNDDTVHPQSLWGHYWQTEQLADAASGKETHGLESSFFNYDSHLPKVDPYTVNIGRQAENLRVDCGQPNIGTLYPCTDALNFLAISGNGYFTGILFGNGSIDSSVLSHPPAIAYPCGATSPGNLYYKATGYSTPAWSTYCTNTTNNGNIISMDDGGLNVTVTVPTGGGLNINNQSVPVNIWNWGTPLGVPPSGAFPNLGAAQPATYVVGQPPLSSSTVSFSATSGAGVTMTFTSAATISAVAITGTAGQFSCTCTGFVVGMNLTLSGTYGGTGSITGYVNPTTYLVSATNGTSTFTLQTLASGAIVTTAGTPTGITYTPGTLLGTAADVGRVLTVNDTTFKYATITTQSTSTVATVTLTGTLSGTGPFTNANIYLSGTPTTNTTPFSVPLPTAFPGVWLYFPVGGICATCNAGGTNASGIYYSTCASTTVCTVFNNKLAGSVSPTILSSPTNFSLTGIGTFTQSTSGMVILSLAIPANAMGPNGDFVVTTYGERNNNVDLINFQGRLNNVTLGQEQTASTIWYPFQRTVRNAGQTNSQVTIASGTGVTNDLSTNTTAPSYMAVDTTVSQNFTLVLANLINATNWYFNLGGNIQLNYSP